MTLTSNVQKSRIPCSPLIMPHHAARQALQRGSKSPPTPGETDQGAGGHESQAVSAAAKTERAAGWGQHLEMLFEVVFQLTPEYGEWAVGT